MEYERELSVRIVLDTNKRTEDEMLIREDCETISEFIERVSDAIQELTDY